MAITEKDLAAALLAAIHGMHPIYGSTSGWRGGIGGQAMTQGCSFIDPPHRNEDPSLHIEGVLRAWLMDNNSDADEMNAHAQRVMKGEVRG